MQTRTSTILVILVWSLFGFAVNLGAQCEPTTDCNANGVLDSCDLSSGTSDDCNVNGIPDECEITGDPSIDCNANGIPDTCEPVGEVSVTTGLGNFGSAMDASGDLWVVGAPAPEIGNGSAGVANVYRRVGTQWILQAQLIPIDQTAGQQFGHSIAVEGDLIAIGAPGDGGITTPGRGAVYIFRNVDGTWMQEQKLVASNGQANDEFGISVDINGDRLVVGAWKELNLLATGSAYVFSHDGSSWAQDVVLLPTDPIVDNRFGQTVAISGDFIGVGAPRANSGVTLDTGAVYIYTSVGTTWFTTQKITAADVQSGSDFGSNLAVDGDLLLVGAQLADNDDGAAYVFKRAGLTYSQTQKLVSGLNNGQFGGDVSITSGHLWIGAWRAEGHQGRGLLYRPAGTSFILDQIVVPLGALDGDRFASAVAASGDYVFGGSPARNFAYSLRLIPAPDCNNNGVEDTCDISVGSSSDCNLDGIPDECEITAGTSSDCNLNGVPDQCELDSGIALDCNLNGVLDQCDIASTQSADCNLNGIPDDCESDCNSNGIADSCEISDGSAPDCNLNGILDQCDILLGFAIDCNSNGIPDTCDLDSGSSLDCNVNLVPDECDVLVGIADDCNLNGILDECDLDSGTSADCNLTGTPDECDIASLISPDCNLNAIPDECDLSLGTSFDCNSNSILDDCDIAATSSADCNLNAIPDECDVANETSLDCNANIVPDECEVNPDPEFPVIAGLPLSVDIFVQPGTCSQLAIWSEPVVTDNCGVASVTSDMNRANPSPLERPSSPTLPLMFQETSRPCPSRLSSPTMSFR